jgi:hypothetical protein
MTATPPKSEREAAPGAGDAQVDPPVAETGADEAKRPGGKASTQAARAAQEDRLAAALRANLARRKAATRAARQSASGPADDDGEA